MTEMVIQQLLLDAGADDVDQDLVAVEPAGLEVAADWRTLQSPETYLGYGQSNGFAQDEVARFDQPDAYTAPAGLPLNSWALSGTWTVARHAAVANEAGGRIAFRFHARDVNLVMGPASAGASIPFRVFLDGQPARPLTGPTWPPTAAGRQRPADLSAAPPTGPDRRSPVRDRIPRRGCRGVLLHVRLIAGIVDPNPSDRLTPTGVPPPPMPAPRGLREAGRRSRGQRREPGRAARGAPCRSADSDRAARRTERRDPAPAGRGSRRSRTGGSTRSDRRRSSLTCRGGGGAAGTGDSFGVGGLRRRARSGVGQEGTALDDRQPGGLDAGANRS